MDNTAGPSISAVIANDEPPIGDGDKDIAKTMDLEQMRVELPGRIPYQKCALWKGSKDVASKPKKKSKTDDGATNINYSVDDDGPTPEHPARRLPDPRELQHSGQTRLYLEVGVVIGGQPDRYKTNRAKSTQVLAKERLERGVHPRDKTAIPAFWPVTDKIDLNQKYVVGTRAVDGLLKPRIIGKEHIFFYNEFWRDVPVNANKDARWVYLRQAITRKASKSDKMVDQPVVAVYAIL
jgi:hypothetical protein